MSTLVFKTGDSGKGCIPKFIVRLACINGVMIEGQELLVGWMDATEGEAWKGSGKD